MCMTVRARDREQGGFIPERSHVPPCSVPSHPPARRRRHHRLWPRTPPHLLPRTGRARSHPKRPHPHPPHRLTRSLSPNTQQLRPPGGRARDRRCRPPREPATAIVIFATVTVGLAP